MMLHGAVYVGQAKWSRINGKQPTNILNTRLGLAQPQNYPAKWRQSDLALGILSTVDSPPNLKKANADHE